VLPRGPSGLSRDPRNMGHPHERLTLTLILILTLTVTIT